MPNSDPMVHSVPVLSALFIPYLLTTESKGLALLPLLCIASYRYRAFFFNHFYLAPFVGLVVGALQGALGPSVLLPLAVPVLLHYCAVSASRLFAKRYKVTPDPHSPANSFASLSWSPFPANVVASPSW